MEDIVNIITTQQSPQILTSHLEKILERKPIIEILRRHREDIMRKVKIEGTGLKPIAITLSGTASIAGFLLSLALFDDSIKYVITSPEVSSGSVSALKLSHLYFKHFVDELKMLEPVIINFSDLPKYEEANMLFEILKKGAIIANGVTVELGIWLGRNSGIGRLIILRPLKDRTVLKYV